MKTDSWLRRFSRICIARPVSAIGVTRNQVTAVRLALGFLAAVVLAFGPAWFSVAATLFLLGMLLARSDDELARLKEQACLASERYAFISDSLSNILAFAGLGVGMRASEYGLTAIAMGLMAGFAVAAVPWLVRRLEVIDGRRSDEFDSIAGVDAADVLLIFPIALWAGWAEALLLVAAFAAPTFAVALYMNHYRKFNSG